MRKILICEDEENIVSFLRKELEYEGFSVEAAADGAEALEKFCGVAPAPSAEGSPALAGSSLGEVASADSPAFSLVLLDIMLPEKNGLECLREIRKISDVPVIMLTARKEVYDKVAFLTAGADDYVTKPFDTSELIARIKRHIQRHSELPENSEKPKILTINPEAYTAKIGTAVLPLTKTEFEILYFLYKNLGKVKTREEIIHAVFGEFYGESNIIDANIKNIRAKIANTVFTGCQIIETVRGKGYVIRNG